MATRKKRKKPKRWCEPWRRGLSSRDGGYMKLCGTGGKRRRSTMCTVFRDEDSGKWESCCVMLDFDSAGVMDVKAASPSTTFSEARQKADAISRRFRLKK